MKNKNVLIRIRSIYRLFLCSFCILFFIPNRIQAQEKEKLIHRLLTELQASQITESHFFQKGTFPAYRYNGSTENIAKPDNNIFFTSLIACTLKEMMPRLKDSANIAICKQIITNAVTSYPQYQNKSGRPTYNFWRTHPVELFPGTKSVQILKKINSLPDDLDDTVLYFLFQDSIPESTKYQLEKLMTASANKSHKTIKNTYKKYKNIPAYSTWFGRKMPVDFDFCVLSNVMYYRYTTHSNLNSTDSATIDLLVKMIQDKAYLKNPAYISPHYGRTPILLYHIAKLMGKFKIEALELYKNQLINDIKLQLQTSAVEMDKLLLHISLLRLNPSENTVFFDKFDFHNLYDIDFSFFQAGIYSYFNNPLKDILNKIPSLHFYFQCPDYNKALLLQYLTLIKR